MSFPRVGDSDVGVLNISTLDTYYGTCMSAIALASLPWEL